MLVAAACRVVDCTLFTKESTCALGGTYHTYVSERCVSKGVRTGTHRKLDPSCFFAQALAFFLDRVTLQKEGYK